jgi:hypothetical protein
MSKRHWWPVAALVLVPAALFFVRPTTGQQPVTQPPSQSRYQMQATTQGGSAVFVCDTQTGQCWWRSTGEGMEWHDIGSPTIKKK